MIHSIPLGFSPAEPMENLPIYTTQLTQTQAEQANLLFDEAVARYLRHWIEQGAASETGRSIDAQTDIDEFIQHGALRVFFKHHPDALEQLLQDTDIARHLLRPSSEVYFQADHYEPLLATFEKRIYNVAAHREHLEVPFRYSPMSRQDIHGNSVGLADMPAHESREDIGCYFGTRRSDTTALSILANQLRREAIFSAGLPIHVIAEGYMADSLRVIRSTTQQLHDEGHETLCCFVLQRRHAVNDRHLGAALLIMDTRQPTIPQRIIFCDTLKPNGRPPWWNKFKGYVDAVFPQLADQVPASDRLEDGGVNLQRLHDGVPVRHQDIDCAFYSASMARALIQITKTAPELILEASIDEIVWHMTGRMQEYFHEPNAPRNPEAVREINVLRRWQTGQEALAVLRDSIGITLIEAATTEPEQDDSRWESAVEAMLKPNLSVAA